jgi:hypothetical protein
MFTLMANNIDILDQFAKNIRRSKGAVDNTYLSGIIKLQEHIRTKDDGVNKFKKHLLVKNLKENSEDNHANSEGGNTSENNLGSQSENLSEGSCDF